MITSGCGGPAAAGAPAATATRVVYENLTAVEADLVEAIVDRLIPTDALGPGAKEAGVVRYIDRALGGALASSRQAYGAGLAALDRYARSSRGAGFLELSATDKDSLLMDVESGSVGPGIFTGSSAQFFGMRARAHRQGMFGDPFYGGNANFAGWDLLRYPGVRTDRDRGRPARARGGLAQAEPSIGVRDRDVQQGDGAARGAPRARKRHGPADAGDMTHGH